MSRCPLHIHPKYQTTPALLPNFIATSNPAHLVAYQQDLMPDRFISTRRHSRSFSVPPVTTSASSQKLSQRTRGRSREQRSSEGQRARKRGCRSRCTGSRPHTSQHSRQAFPYFYHRRPLSDFSNIPSTYGSRILRAGNVYALRRHRACLACYRLLFSSPFRPAPGKRATPVERESETGEQREREWERASEVLRPALSSEPSPATSLLAEIPLEPDSSSPFPVFVYLNFNAESPRCSPTFLPSPFLLFAVSTFLSRESAWRRWPTAERSFVRESCC